jgi:hypothetical protein
VIEGKRQVIGMGQAASIGASSTTASDSGVNKPVNLLLIAQATFLARSVLMAHHLNTLLILVQRVWQ